MTSIEPLIRTKSLAERTYEQLKDLILSSSLEPGQIVTETWLSSALSVSRTPVRVALSRLMAEGLMVAADGQVHVRQISVYEAQNVSDLRLAIEGHVARSLALSGLSSSAIDDLQELLQSMAALVDERGQCFDTKSFFALNRQFHLRLAEETENPLLVEAADRVLDLMILAGLIVLHAPGRAGTVIREHGAILEAIEMGDPALAFEAVRIHTTGVDHTEVIDLYASDA